MRVVESEEEMELSGKEVISFDQLVRIFVDTDVDTHFIVSLSRTATVADLRGEFSVSVGSQGLWIGDGLR